MQNDEDIPVYKVGAVVLRQRKGGGHTSSGDVEMHDPVEVLLIRPKPTEDGPNTPPKYALPRGSRQYESRDADGCAIWLDIRNKETAQQVTNRIEPVGDTLLREMEEEAGIKPADILHPDAVVYEMRERPHVSSSKPGASYPIYWYVIWADDAMEKNRNPLPDAVMQTRWCTLDELDVLKEQGLLSEGYLPVIQEAISQSMSGALAPANLRAQQLNKGLSR